MGEDGWEVTGPASMEEEAKGPAIEETATSQRRTRGRGWGVG